MISLRELADLAERYRDDLDHPVAPLRLGDRVIDTDTTPAVMGVVNLSRDSTYRDSIAVSVDSAVRRGRALAARGADVVDVGAEATQQHAARVDAGAQAAAVVPVVSGLVEAGVVTSIESYEPETVEAALRAGARVVNLSGSADDDAVFDLVARHRATLVLCHVYGSHARDLDAVEVPDDPIPEMLDGFGARLEAARTRGVTDVVVDPGIGFGFRSLPDPVDRVRHQARVLLHTFRLRRLGVPVCHALPHGFDLFEDQFRSAEGFFAVLASLGGTGMYRTHEVPLTRSVLEAMRALDIGGAAPTDSPLGRIGLDHETTMRD